MKIFEQFLNEAPAMYPYKVALVKCRDVIHYSGDLAIDFDDTVFPMVSYYNRYGKKIYNFGSCINAGITEYNGYHKLYIYVHPAPTDPSPEVELWSIYKKRTLGYGAAERDENFNYTISSLNDLMLKGTGKKQSLNLIKNLEEDNISVSDLNKILSDLGNKAKSKVKAYQEKIKKEHPDDWEEWEAEKLKKAAKRGF